MKCIVCKKKGGSNIEGVVTLQSTTMGSVCPKCIDVLVSSYIKGTEYWRR